MLKKDKGLLLLLALMLVAFGFGVVRLFQLRFESGDVYPPYSSLRADPLGTKALYESLENLRGLSAHRFVRQLDKLGEGRGTTMFVLGAGISDMELSTEDEYKTLERFMFDGGRIVVSFAPVNIKPWATRREEAKDEKKSAKNAKEKSPEKKTENADEQEEDEYKRAKRRRPPNEDQDFPGASLISLKERWGVGFGYEDLPKGADGIYQSVVARREAESGLPESVTWHTALYFENPGTNWNSIYKRGRRGALIERKFGSGSLVFCADSYFLSNEAMRKERHPALLAWLVGANRNVLFDETHLGVVEEPGIAVLVRKYRLHSLIVGLAMLAGLFVWKSAVPFVPPHEEERSDSASAVTGKDSASGFVNLLRRNVPPSELLSVCFAEWKKSGAHDRADPAGKTDRMAAVIAEEQARPARQRNAVESYRRISGIVAERK